MTQVPVKRRAVRVPGRDPVREVDPLARYYLDDDPIVQRVTAPKTAEQRALEATTRRRLGGLRE